MMEYWIEFVRNLIDDFTSLLDTCKVERLYDNLQYQWWFELILK